MIVQTNSRQLGFLLELFTAATAGAMSYFGRREREAAAQQAAARAQQFRELALMGGLAVGTIFVVSWAFKRGKK